MLEVVNRYLHGFVAVPLAGAARDVGILARLRRSPATATGLSAELALNTGYCRIVLRGLHCLGWVESRDFETYWATPAADALQRLPQDWVDLYSVDFGRFLDSGEAGPAFSRWFAASEAAWDGADLALQDLIDAPIVVQLMLELAGRNRGRPAEAIGARLETRVHARARPGLLRWMRARGLLEPQDRARLTARGAYLYERALTMGVTASYRPMLRQLGSLLCGDPTRVLGRDAEGHETYVDRTLNVVGSGFQHGKYFADMVERVVAIFDQTPLEAQPKYIVDTGCGDGVLLKTLHTAVAERSLRGRHLGDFPLRMVGVDYNQRSIDASAVTLNGVPHMLLRGDISDPAAIMADLFARGVSHADEVLHVRSFLDHDRPMRIEPAGASGLPGDDHVYVSHTGETLATVEIFDELVAHLSRWSAVLGVHGLLFLEVFTLPVSLTRRYFDETESFSFDIYHALSRQALVEAGVFHQALAAAGLYPEQQSLARYPRTMPYSRIVLQHVKPQDFRVRALRRDDIPALLEIDRLCWPQNLRTSEAEILARHDAFPSGQLVIERQGRPAGVLYTQRIDALEPVLGVPASQYVRLHDRDGRFWQLIGISVHPDFQAFAFGDRLLEYALDLAALTPGVEAVYGVTRCLDFAAATAPFDRYIHMTDGQGRPLDSMLRFHHAHGAVIERAAPGARPADLVNQGFGVLIRYDVTERFGRALSHGGSESEPKAVVAEAVQRLMRDPAAFDAERPLRELGLDSMSLMELRILLNDRLGLEFEPGFFFNYPTPAAIADFVRRRGATEAPAAQVAVTPLPMAAPERTDRRRSPGSADADDIAIIGMSLRLPGGIDSPASYWRMLAEGRCVVGPRPQTRWREFSDELSRLGPELDHIHHGGFLNVIDRFDAGFFNITPVEARALDPQQRLLLELSWEALEGAGVDPRRLAGRDVGVLLGAYTHDYEAISLKGRPLGDVDAYFGTGNALSAAAGRLAYFYDFRGPAMTVDTACSSSSCAVHAAVRSLLDGGSEVALAGSVNLMMTPVLSVAFARANMLSTDGLCKTFDAEANGYVRGEGATMMVLKRLADAERDRDPVRAVIKAAEVMQDGRTNGLTAPNGRAQADIIRRALARAGKAPADISYVEAHGTGTRLGDPVEMEALSVAYCGDGRTAPLAVGSVKTNIGHTEAVSGMAGLIKAVLAIENRTIPAHLNLRKMSDLLQLPAAMEIPTEARPWTTPDGAPRTAGISSYGFSGTNTHIIVEEYLPSQPTAPVASTAHPALPFVISGKTEAALSANVQAVAAFVAAQGEALDIAALSATLTRGRAQHARRTAFAFSSAADLRGKLDAARSAAPSAPSPPRIAFMFTGQGSQYHGMAKQLAELSTAFRASLDDCNALVEKHAGVALFDILWGDPGLIDQTRYTQPALFCVEYSLAELLRRAGIEAKIVLGHSVGEFAAACYAAMIDLEGAIRLLCRRGALMQDGCEAGAMAAILATPEQVDELLRGRRGIAVAAFNGPRNQVVSGETQEVAAVSAAAEAMGYTVFQLPVSRAFHSPLMDPILQPFHAHAAEISCRAPRIPLISNLDGEVRETSFSAADWTDHIRRPVEFDRSMKALVRSGVDLVIEIGPRPTLTNLARDAAGTAPVAWLSTLQAKEKHSLAAVFAQAAAAGLDVDWSVYPHPPSSVLTELPTYRFDRSSYWIAPVQEARPAQTRSLRGHVVDGEWIFPASAYVSAALAAAAGSSGKLSLLTGFEFRQRLTLESDAEPTLRTTIVDGRLTLESFNQARGGWIACASCAVEGVPTSPDVRWGEPQAPLSQLSADAFYAALGRWGYEYSGAFRAVRTISFGRDEAVAELAASASEAAEDVAVASSTLDACFQVALASLLDETRGEFQGRILLPVEIGVVAVHAAIVGDMRVHCRYRNVARGLLADLQVSDMHGRRCADVKGLVFAAIPRRSAPAIEPMVIGWEALPSAPPTKLEGRWVVLDDETGFASSFADALRESGASVQSIAAPFPGEGYPGAALDAMFVRLAAALEAPAAGLVCSWPAAAPHGGRGVPAVLLALLQFICSLPRRRLGSTLFVTRDAHVVSQGDLGVDEGGAAAWGMVAAFRAETSAPAVSAVDLPARETDAAKLRGLAAAALAAVARPATAPVDVAARAEGLFVQRLRSADSGPPVPIRAGAAYVITGGLGGLGRLAAEYLHAQGAGRILLLGRTVHPRPDWMAALDRTRDCIEIVGCDVTDRASVVAAAARFGDLPVHGLIHAAGLTADSVLAGQSKKRLAEVYAPKLTGLRHLLEVLQADKLDFAWLYSSLVGLYGGAGQINYAAANAALDAQARGLRARGIAATSVSWGPWSGVGMASKLARPEALAARMFAGSLTPEQSREIFDALRRFSGPQVVIAPWRRDLIDAADDLPQPLISLRRNPRASAARRSPARVPVRSARALKALIAERISVVSGVETAAVYAAKALADLGMDSLMYMQLSETLQDALGVSIEAATMFGLPTLAAVTEHVLARSGVSVVDAAAEGLAVAPVATVPAGRTVDLGADLDVIEGLNDEALKALLGGRVFND